MNEKFEKIIHFILSTTETIHEVNDQITSLTSASQEISSSMEIATKETEETTEDFISISDSISEQKCQVENIRKTLEQMKNSFSTSS
ncbi:hypothetical protein [Bacillus sp. FJAT-45350]|uniref:hypothetical protein n=1 Tax=Bacillus sp. FJAT-45350 TaxID=2011014 RepID=UPI000BB823EC|nr:hypothetical protein [Bacillus sp. FJAT-45350]